ncbi:hypothetical protein BBJ28_00016305 [Nothophytophthora sp. Chile5]|nr:hypothetical protein BBJ28_00016305 [Nothophytophthora sp. Chile5]
MVDVHSGADREEAAAAVTGDTPNDEVVLDALAAAVADVKCLELRHFKLDDVAVQQLNTLFHGCQHDFQSFSMAKCTLSDRFCAFTTEKLSSNGVKLAQFRLRSCLQVSMTSLIAMSALFSSSLVTLELSSCKLPRQAGIILSQSLQGCPSLRHLLLADNNLRDGGLRAIADALKLLHASSGSAVATVLGQELESSASTLEQLDVSRNGLTSAGLMALLQLPVRCLSVSGNAIESGVDSLLLSNAPTLETLYLTANPLSMDGKLEIARALFKRSERAGRSALRELDLRGCGFASVNGLSLLQSSFQQAATAGQQCTLRSLYLDGSIEDETERETYGRSCEALKETATASFPGLRLRFQSDSDHQKLPETTLPSPRRSAGRKRGKEAILLPSSGLGAELEALALATKASVNASLASVVRRSSSPLPEQQQLLEADEPGPEVLTFAMAQIQPLQQTKSSSTAIVTSPLLKTESVAPLPLQNVDVEYIVSKTIQCMNQNFEQRLGQFLSRMETQQQERNSAQIQFLTAKVEACERALPRLEARLDVLTDRVAGGNTQLAKLQTDVALQLQHMRQEALTQQVAGSYGSSGASTTALSARMQSQVEELVASRLQASEQRFKGELELIRAATPPTSTPTDPRAVVDAVSVHLTQFKREFDANQSGVLRQFAEEVTADGRRMEQRIAQVEAQLDNVEAVIQAEQQASLLALEAISDAFSGPAAISTPRKAR